MNLLNKKCVPCEGGTPPFTPEQIADYSKQVSGWEVLENKKIQKSFKFKNFKTAIGFVDRVAALAESEGHHPDMEIHYNRLVFTLTTHAIGGLSENDFILAAKIDALPLASASISIDEFAKVQIKMGKILTAERVEGSDKLLKLSIDLGPINPMRPIQPMGEQEAAHDVRTIVSGIAQFYTPEAIIGKTVPVITNLAPRTMKGIESNGMVLFGIDETDGAHKPIMLNPDKDLPPGSPVA